MKALIIQQKMIGDVLTSSILFEALKEKYPQSELHYAINSHTQAVVAGNPHIDEYRLITPEIERSKIKFYAFLKSLRAEKYDAVIDVYSKLSSNLMTQFTGARTKVSKHKRYTSKLYSHTYNEAITAKTNAGLAIENRLQLLEPFGICEKLYKPKIYLTEPEIIKAKEKLIEAGVDMSKPVFMIGVTGSKETKTYPLKYMAELIDVIAQESEGQMLFNYVPDQGGDAKAVYGLCDESTKKRIFLDLFGRSLREFFAITHHCSAFIGNEGGATNMAKALSIPTFTIFSPWIMKEAWNVFDDGIKNVSIHLKDVKPQLYQDKSLKHFKSNALSSYDAFVPEFIAPKLRVYLRQF